MVINLQIELEVKPETPGVKVGRADKGPAPVDHQQFAVDERWRNQCDGHSSLQQFRQVGRGCPLDRQVIAFFRKQDPNFHAGEDSASQGLDEGPVGNKIGSHNKHFLPGGAQGAENDLVDLLEVFGGPTCDGSDQSISQRFRL